MRRKKRFWAGWDALAVIIFLNGLLMNWFVVVAALVVWTFGQVSEVSV